MSQNLKPLVSVVVVTYNSAKFVIETLESIKNQDYENIELIVTDDCSKDDTVQVCTQWIQENKARFHRTQCIHDPKNTGIPHNCNRGLKASSGDYIKLIAGDDLLNSNCISRLVRYFIDHPEFQVCFSAMTKIDASGAVIGSIRYTEPGKQFTFDNQFEENEIFAPSSIFTREVFDRIGNWDESLPIEDWDFNLRLLDAGFVVNYLDEELVCYRIHGSNTTGKEKFMFHAERSVLDKWKAHAHYKGRMRRFYKLKLCYVNRTPTSIGLLLLLKSMISFHPFALTIFANPLNFAKLLRSLLFALKNKLK